MNNNNAMPEGLSAAGKKAYKAVVKGLPGGVDTDTGGCKTFYSPQEWKDRGEEYGCDSVLVVVYDGGNVRPYFNMDAAYEIDSWVYAATGKTREPYGTTEGMIKVLKGAGFWSEECTGWYAAIYKA